MRVLIFSILVIANITFIHHAYSSLRSTSWVMKEYGFIDVVSDQEDKVVFILHSEVDRKKTERGYGHANGNFYYRITVKAHDLYCKVQKKRTDRPEVLCIYKNDDGRVLTERIQIYDNISMADINEYIKKNINKNQISRESLKSYLNKHRIK